MPTTLARTSDPATSHAAAKQARAFITTNGKRIIDVLRNAPFPLCVVEIATRGGFAKHETVGRRMSGLRDAGKVQELPPKQVDGRWYTTYAVKESTNEVHS